jgi:hypothetical protein
MSEIPVGPAALVPANGKLPGNATIGGALSGRGTGERDVPNANSQQYRCKAAEYERLVMENAGLSICEEFQRAHRSLIALAEKEEWLSRGTLSREPQWVDASALPPLRARSIRNPFLEASTGPGRERSGIRRMLGG